jgi:hypothetical protein
MCWASQQTHAWGLLRGPAGGVCARQGACVILTDLLALRITFLFCGFELAT